MDNKLEKLLHFFYEISKIPRQSGKEEKIANYLENFAKERNLECYRDLNNNVLIKKKSNINSNNILIMQAHMDMVCVKTKESNHDFDVDSIQIVQDGDVIRAKDTSLGGDDGIGVAIMLYILDSKEIKHANLECLFTTEEETTFGGAVNFDYTKLNGTSLVNFDGCEDDTIVIGCDGDICNDYFTKVKLIDNTLPSYKVKISNLKGGNSGENLNKNRTNAIVLMGKILEFLSKNDNLYITSINGGTSEIDIATDCECIINTNIKEIDKKINIFLDKFKFSDEEPIVEVERIRNSKTFTLEISKNIINEVINLKQDIITKDKSDIITSGNVGVIITNADEVRITWILKSINIEELNYYNEESKKISKLNKFNIDKVYDDSSWNPKSESAIRDKYIDSYYKVNLKKPNLKISNGGIECSVFNKCIKNIDMISIGAIIENIHTVDERIYISSCKKVLETLIHFLANF